MIGKNFLVLFLVSILPFIPIAQIWDIDSCINYGIRNSPEIQQSKLELKIAQVNVNYQKYNNTPNLNGGISHGYNWGQSIDPFTNEFATQRVRTNNLFLTSNYNLFSGLRNYYQNKRYLSEVSFVEYNNSILRRNLKIKITAVFLQNLIEKKNTELIAQKIEITLAHKEKIQSLIAENELVENKLLEIESQLLRDSLEYLQSKNRQKLELNNLKQIIGYKERDTLYLESTFNSSSEYIQSNFVESEKLLDIKKIEVSKEIENYRIKMIKSNYYPSLVLSGAIGSGYSGNNNEIVNGVLMPKTFINQLDENFYQTLNITLSFPILNKGEIRKNIEISMIELEKKEEEKRKVLLDIENIINKLQIEIKNLEAEKKATKKLLAFAEKSFELFTVKYEEGEITFIKLLEVKNEMFKAKSQLIDCQTILYLKYKILEYYTTPNYNHFK